MHLFFLNFQSDIATENLNSQRVKGCIANSVY